MTPKPLSQAEKIAAWEAAAEKVMKADPAKLPARTTKARKKKAPSKKPGA